jgi:hypothetical protein
MAPPTLTIDLPKADFVDLCDGQYYLHFTREVIDATTTTKKALGVWAYKPLAGSILVKGKSKDTKESRTE